MEVSGLKDLNFWQWLLAAGALGWVRFFGDLIYKIWHTI